jgi:hypothetical protein
MRFLLTASLFLGATLAPVRADDTVVEEPGAATPWLAYNPRCTEQQWKRLRPGMSVHAATAVLRCPPGDYTCGKGIYVAFLDTVSVDGLQRDYAKCWFGCDGAIGLVLDQQGKVDHADWYPALDPGSGR